MKKVIKICILLVTLMLAFSILAICVSASTCEGELVNIAGQATASGDIGHGTSNDDVHWEVSDHYKNAIDGDPMTNCPVDTNHNRAYGLRITFDGPYKLEKVVIQPYGHGRAQSTIKAWENWKDRTNGQNIEVFLYGESGSYVFYQKYQAGTENIEITLDSSVDPVNQIYIYFNNVQVAQGIWEVEAYTRETHTWVQTGVKKAATCITEGQSTVQCTKCQAVEKGIICPTGHKDICQVTCGNDGCNKALYPSIEKVYHVRSSPCSDTCIKCNQSGVFTASAHVADLSKPCSNTCVICGEDKVPNAYDIPNVYTTGKYKPYNYAKHVANPNDPCSSTCIECEKPNTVAARHTPGATTGAWAVANNTTINPCSSRQCAECGLENAYPQNPHVRRTDKPCSRECAKKCNETTWFAHEFDSCGDNTCAHCGGGWPAERAHTFTAQSPTKCIGCGYNNPDICLKHEYDNNCDTKCNLCQTPRYGGRDDHSTIPEIWHILESGCDSECNDCKATVAAAHNYKKDCSEICSDCGQKRTTLTAHTYDHDCDGECNECGETREITHFFDYACDPLCGNVKCENPTRDVRALHLYDSVCDTSCGNVGCIMPDRKVPHVYTSDCDAVCDTEGCGFTRTVEGHKYTNDCDTVCDVEKCGFTRTPNPHKYDNDCDVDCNVCKTAREVAGHGYDNDCDADCNTCGITREVQDHKYDNACDGDCNSCGATRTTQHSFSVWMTTTEPTKKEDGVSTRYCTVCNFDETQAIPAEGGMSTGAVVAIVVGSVSVAGGGGFCLYWFVLKKKFLG